MSQHSRTLTDQEMIHKQDVYKKSTGGLSMYNVKNVSINVHVHVNVSVTGNGNGNGNGWLW